MTATDDLELDALAVELYCTNLEVDSNGGNERGGPGIIAETQEKT